MRLRKTARDIDVAVPGCVISRTDQPRRKLQSHAPEAGLTLQQHPHCARRVISRGATRPEKRSESAPFWTGPIEPSMVRTPMPPWKASNSFWCFSPTFWTGTSVPLVLRPPLPAFATSASAPLPPLKWCPLRTESVSDGGDFLRCRRLGRCGRCGRWEASGRDGGWRCRWGSDAGVLKRERRMLKSSSDHREHDDRVRISWHRLERRVAERNAPSSMDHSLDW